LPGNPREYNQKETAQLLSIHLLSFSRRRLAGREKHTSNSAINPHNIITVSAEVIDVRVYTSGYMAVQMENTFWRRRRRRREDWVVAVSSSSSTALHAQGRSTDIYDTRTPTSHPALHKFNSLYLLK
jgi:hypothetical protein